MGIDLFRWWQGLFARDVPRKQAAALPYAFIEGRLAFLLITSRRRGRWIVPKGELIDGLSPAQSAAQEALEEAGVEGEVATRPLGYYRTLKDGGRVRVALYPLHVRHQHDTWEEQDQRYRHWVLMPEARRLLTDRHLTALIARFHRDTQPDDQKGTTSAITQ